MVNGNVFKRGQVTKEVCAAMFLPVVTEKGGSALGWGKERNSILEQTLHVDDVIYETASAEGTQPLSHHVVAGSFHPSKERDSHAFEHMPNRSIKKMTDVTS